MFLELIGWGFSTIATIASGIFAIAFAGFAKEASDIQEQKFCASASSMMWFLCVVAGIVSYMLAFKQ